MEIQIVMLAELILVIVEALMLTSRRFLPLGGSHISQIGLLFAFTVIVIDGQSIFFALLNFTSQS